MHASLRELQQQYASCGVNLVRINGKWTFRTASDLAWLLSQETTEPRKLSRAAIETLAIIAYHQPVTRVEIENIRGVTTSKGSVDVLLGNGMDPSARAAKVPGRPDNLWDDRRIFVALRPRRDRRSARGGGAQRVGIAGWTASAGILGANALG